MKLKDLPAACAGKNAQQIDALIKSTDEYQLALANGKPIEISGVYTAGVLLVRGNQDTVKGALWQAAEQAMIVDAALQLIEQDQTLTWVPSGPFKELLAAGSDDSFVQFLGGTELDLHDSRTRLNCWEAIIVAAMHSGVIKNGTSLIQLYQSGHKVFNQQLSRALASSQAREYRPGEPLGTPVRGDIVLFSGLDHVAVATGNSNAMGTEIVSFWPAPELPAKKFKPNGTPTQIQVTTIEAIGAWLVINMPNQPAPHITFGPPDWQQLNQK
jgi:hypothetical protein